MCTCVHVYMRSYMCTCVYVYMCSSQLRLRTPTTADRHCGLVITATAASLASAEPPLRLRTATAASLASAVTSKSQRPQLRPQFTVAHRCHHRNCGHAFVATKLPSQTTTTLRHSCRSIPTNADVGPPFVGSCRSLALGCTAKTHTDCFTLSEHMRWKVNSPTLFCSPATAASAARSHGDDGERNTS